MRILEESIFTRFDVRGNPEKNPAEGTVFIARKARMNPQLKKGAMAEDCVPEGKAEGEGSGKRCLNNHPLSTNFQWFHKYRIWSEPPRNFLDSS